ncbi:hypothetical protein B0H13DRAFT_2345227 [Mycena leptocephala]|nr:hypothetical protein B0H13DRAFT_2345227 [Mycena leptocephala]
MTQSDIIIPPGFIDKFVWSPFKDVATYGAAEPINELSYDHPPLRQSYAFPDCVVSEVLAAASYAFSRASQLGGMEPSEFHSLDSDKDLPEEPTESQFLDSDEDLPEEPSICLFTPYEGCHEIIDSMIQSVANQLKADIIVLYALELALGEFGALGKDIGEAISAVYEHKSKLDRRRIRAAFDAIVNVPNKIAPSNVNLTEASKCRFIYLRDFGSIAQSAEPLMTRLLHAIRVRRSAVYVNTNASNSNGILHPTVLVMGFDKASTIASEVDFSDTDSWHFGFHNPYNPKPTSPSRSSIFSEGGDALRKTLPPLGSRLFRLKSQFTKISLKALPAAFFLPLVSNSSEVETAMLPSAQYTVIRPFEQQLTATPPFEQLPATPPFGPFEQLPTIPPFGQHTVIPALREECICLIPQNFQESCVLDLTYRGASKRKMEVQNTLLVLLLRQQGVLVADDLLSLILTSATSADTLSGVNPNNTLLSDVLDDLPDIPFPVAVSRIATKAIGLAHLKPRAQTPIRINAEDVSKAHAIFVENSRTLSHWDVESRQKAKAKEDKLGEISSQSNRGSSDSDGGETSGAHEKNSAGAGEKEQKDPIVEGVKSCRDLNEYEEMLLPCIVDCGK